MLPLFLIKITYLYNDGRNLRFRNIINKIRHQKDKAKTNRTDFC